MSTETLKQTHERGLNFQKEPTPFLRASSSSFNSTKSDPGEGAHTTHPTIKRNISMILKKTSPVSSVPYTELSSNLLSPWSTYKSISIEENKTWMNNKQLQLSEQLSVSQLLGEQLAVSQARRNSDSCYHGGHVLNRRFCKRSKRGKLSRSPHSLSPNPR